MAVIKLQNEQDAESGRYFEFDPDDKSTILGKGGMGVVFKGKLIHSDTGKYEWVAIKVLFNDLTESSLERAHDEAAIQIMHENIVRMYGLIKISDNDNRLIYHIISEYLDGETLSELIRKSGTLSKERAIMIIRCVLSALDMLHRSGYIHRDIDPSNVMICKDGKIKLIDFGIAKKISVCQEQSGEYAHSTKTLEGLFIGKVNYASPEQLKGQLKDINAKSDIYSTGILLYELLTGRLPFTGSSYDILKGHQEEPIPKDRVFLKEKELKWLFYVVCKATAKKKEERYRTANDFIVDIEKIEKGLSPVPVPVRKIASAVGVAALLIACIFGIWTYMDHKKDHYRELVTQASGERAMAMYPKALDSYNAAFQIIPADSVAEAIQLLELLTLGLERYIHSDYGEADSLFRLATERYSSPEAYYYLGEMCHEGLGRPRDSVKGLEYATEASRLGSIPAEYRLGIDYKNGYGVKKDEKKASFCFANVLRMVDNCAADNPELQFLKGNLYKYGDVPDMNGESNRKTAIECYRLAAEKGYPPAEYELYLTLEENGEKKEWLARAAGQGYVKAEFMQGIELMEQERYAEGLEWIEKAAGKNHVPALRELGVIYLKNASPSVEAIRKEVHITTDDATALEYTQKALEYDSEDYMALHDMGIAYSYGRGVKKDEGKARTYRNLSILALEKRKGFSEAVHPHEYRIRTYE
ncbi:MAG: protein kinase [Tannerella sp.]|jgi:serine/threonine protein kinase|nr:protein kinase [Tannerella sp.]